MGATSEGHVHALPRRRSRGVRSHGARCTRAQHRIHDDEIVDREGGVFSTSEAAQTMFTGAKPRVAAMLTLVADRL